MVNLYECRVFFYFDDKEVVKEFIEKGGVFGIIIGMKFDRQRVGDDRVLEFQKEKFEREV